MISVYSNWPIKIYLIVIVIRHKALRLTKSDNVLVRKIHLVNKQDKFYLIALL